MGVLNDQSFLNIYTRTYTRAYSAGFDLSGSVTFKADISLSFEVESWNPGVLVCRHNKHMQFKRHFETIAKLFLHIF